MKSFSELLQEAKSNTEFWLQGAIVDFTEDVVRRMNEESITRAQLAEKINVNPAYVTKILRGNTNFTLETMVKVGRALNSRVRIHLEREDCQSEWIDFLAKEPVVPATNGWNEDSYHKTTKTFVSINETVPTAA